MDYQQKNENGYLFLILSTFLAIFSFLTIQFIIFPFILGGLSILFAILGRGGNARLCDKGILSVSLSCISMLLTILLTCYAVFMLLTDPTTRQQVNDFSTQINGESLDDMFEKNFGTELPDLGALD